MFSGLHKSVAKLAGKSPGRVLRIPEENDTLSWIRIETTQFSALCNSLLESVTSLMTRPPSLVPRITTNNKPDGGMKFSKGSDSTTLVEAWQEYVQILKRSEEKASKVDAAGEVTGISTQLNDCIGLANTVLNSCSERDRLWWKMQRCKEVLQTEFTTEPTKMMNGSSSSDNEHCGPLLKPKGSISSRVWSSKSYKRLVSMREKDGTDKREKNINYQVSRIKALEEEFDDATQHVELEFQRLLGNRMSVIEEILAETFHLLVSIGETEYSNLSIFKEKIPSLIESSQSRRVELGLPIKRFDWYENEDNDDDTSTNIVSRINAAVTRSSCVDSNRERDKVGSAPRRSSRSQRYLSSTSSSCDIPAPLSRRQQTQSRYKHPST